MVESYLSELLPEKYKKRHRLMLYQYDILVDILIKADKFNLSDLSFEFTNEISNNLDILDELKKRHDIEISEKIYIPHIFFSLLKDLNYYLFESLGCIERGKVTVAFSLARKPLQDSLFYLAWILVNPRDFLEKIQYEDPKCYDVSNFKGKKSDLKILFSKAKKIIKSRNSSFNFIETMINEELLYDVIYNRKAPNSLTSVFDQSIHLVTVNRNYPTEKQNLNFVFADDKIWDDFWDLYYEKVPHIVHFLIEIAISIFENMMEIDPKISEYNGYIRNLKFMFACDNNIEESKELESFFELLLDDEYISMTCDRCENQFYFDDKLKSEIKYEYLFTCQKCKMVERVGQYFISDATLDSTKKIIIDNSDDKNWKLALS